MPILNEVIEVLERLAPPYLAEAWDNVGLLLGSRSQKVDKVLCALDLNEEVAEEAITLGVDCIITHHPFLFKPLKALDLDTQTGRILAKLIKAEIALYAMHTNYDAAIGGLNDYLCKGLGLEATSVLQTIKEEKLYKCQVYVPKTHLDKVREAIVIHNPCQLGAYSGCTFTALGEGTFKPLANANPYIGTSGVLEKVEEGIISFVTERQVVSYVLEQIKKVHPYEEVAFDVFEMENMKVQYGIGRVGVLPQEVSLDAFIDQVKAFFNVTQLRVTKVRKENDIRRVAICSGSGAEFIGVAANKADVYITGDLKFHEAQLAYSLGLTVIDVGHYASESIGLKPIGEAICNEFKDCEVIESRVNGEMLFIK